MKHLYPVTIVSTRYGGCYEGGPWAAFNHYPDSGHIDGHDAGDVECAEWWDAHRDDEAVAVGATPDEALRALQTRNQFHLHAWV